jgi:hypothetical protein
MRLDLHDQLHGLGSGGCGVIKGVARLPSIAAAYHPTRTVASRPILVFVTLAHWQGHEPICKQG